MLVAYCLKKQSFTNIINNVIELGEMRSTFSQGGNV